MDIWHALSQRVCLPRVRVRISPMMQQLRDSDNDSDSLLDDVRETTFRKSEKYHSIYFSSSVCWTEAQRDVATSQALRVLECDTKIMTSRLTKGKRMAESRPRPISRLHQDLRRPPFSEQVRQLGRLWVPTTKLGSTWSFHNKHELLTQSS